MLSNQFVNFKIYCLIHLEFLLNFRYFLNLPRQCTSSIHYHCGFCQSYAVGSLTRNEFAEIFWDIN